MKILVLNAGSSSVKFKLFDMPAETVLASGSIERIGETRSRAHIVFGDSEIARSEPVSDHETALRLAASLLKESGTLPHFANLAGIGHRVVHGGEAFYRPTLIDTAVLNKINTLAPLAPLHNPANARGIRAMRTLAPGIPQVAVFDTAFHHTLPPEAYRYAVPEHYYTRAGIRRYGFHGTSHGYVTEKAAALLGKTPETLNLITLHLGNGASACAVERGRSIDTSMGMTPLEGLVMGTRSGDIDPGALTYLARESGMDFDAIDRLLNKQSGLKGLAGTNDMRDIETKMRQGDTHAALAFALFVRRIRKYIGAYAAVLGRLDAVVFTGGIGEHSSRVRAEVCRNLDILGIVCDKRRNASLPPEGGFFHAPESAVALCCVATDEEKAIARQTLPFCR